MTIKLRYLQRLGDACLLLHTAHVLHGRGHRVLIECYPKFADILKCCSYVEYSNPYCPKPADQTYNLAIHPDGGGTKERYEAYRRTGKRWSEFVIDEHEELRGTYGPPVFDKGGWFNPEGYGLPSDGRYAVVCATGYSQQVKYDPQAVVALAKRLYPGVPLYQLSDKPSGGGLFMRRLRDLPGLLAHARSVLTINTATAIIAAGVRSSYEHLPQTGGASQDDTSFAGISNRVKL